MENNTIVTIPRDTFDSEIRFVIDNDIKIHIYIYMYRDWVEEKRNWLKKMVFATYTVQCTIFAPCCR